MKIFVCIKQVPDMDARIKLMPDQSNIDVTGIKWIINPYDLFAIEEAVKLKEANAGAQVFVLTAGAKPRVSEALVTALAMGADEGIFIQTTAQLDAYQTGKALAQVIAAEGGAHVIFTGKSSSDLNQSSVSQVLAESLGLPHATVISKIQYSPESVIVDRDVDGGAKEILNIQLPAVLAANKGLNTPRYTSLPGIMKAKKKVLKEIDYSSLGLSDSDAKVKYSNYTLPAEKPAAKLLAGDVSAQVSELVKLLRDESKVL